MSQIKNPLKKILELTQSQWDHPGTPDHVRDNFRKVLMCRTPALGGEEYGSAAARKIFYHTCKGKCCPTCGGWGTTLWQREQWVALPNIPWVGIVLTMPHVFWPVFKAHPDLEHDLPALGAAVVQDWAWKQYRARLYGIVILHTFGGYLNHYPHLHMMVSADGLNPIECRWVRSLKFEPKEIRELWRFAVTSYLYKAHRDGLLQQSAIPEEFNDVILGKVRCYWNIHITLRMSKFHFLEYAGRYIRRLPISQKNILAVSEQEVVYLAKDTREKAHVEVRNTPGEFVAILAQHILDRYKHSMRYFGLLAPRTKRITSAGVFALLGQQPRPKPQRPRWAEEMKKRFGVDPLVDEFGNPMRWIGRVQPVDGDAQQTPEPGNQ
jgi:hypothetical protein